MIQLLSIAYEYMLFSVTLTGILATRLYINLRASTDTLSYISSPELSAFQAMSIGTVSLMSFHSLIELHMPPV